MTWHSLQSLDDTLTFNSNLLSLTSKGAVHQTHLKPVPSKQWSTNHLAHLARYVYQCMHNTSPSHSIHQELRCSLTYRFAAVWYTASSLLREHCILHLFGDQTHSKRLLIHLQGYSEGMGTYQFSAARLLLSLSQWVNVCVCVGESLLSQLVFLVAACLLL